MNNNSAWEQHVKSRDSGHFHAPSLEGECVYIEDEDNDAFSVVAFDDSRLGPLCQVATHLYDSDDQAEVNLTPEQVVQVIDAMGTWLNRVWKETEDA